MSDLLFTSIDALLKACPDCGSEDVRLRHDSDGDSDAVCASCGACSEIFPNDLATVAAWNDFAHPYCHATSDGCSWDRCPMMGSVCPLRVEAM